MSPVLQWLIVLPLVAGAALFAAWRLMTSRLRLRLLSRLLHALPAAQGGMIGRWRRNVSARIAAESASGCAACSKH
jgi:hypothetical protein